jgi:hypothetical protein
VGQAGITTARMLAAVGTMEQFAAKRCGDYVSGEYTEWLLPTIEDLQKIHANKDIVKGFTKEWYWSSNERIEDQFFTNWWKYAYAMDFSRTSGNYIWNSYQKNNFFCIRPIHYF